jgi:hypothetical protein
MRSYPRNAWEKKALLKKARQRSLFDHSPTPPLGFGEDWTMVPTKA